MHPLIELCANEVPTNWVDPLLTGEASVIGQQPYNGLDIEQLLFAIKERIRAIPQSAIDEAGEAACVCGNPSSLGIVHRTDGPCFVYAAPAALPEGYVMVPQKMLNRMVEDEITSGGPGPLYNVGYAAACHYWGNLLLAAARNEEPKHA